MSKPAKGDYPVPYSTRDEAYVTYPDGWRDGKQPGEWGYHEWRENVPFTATIRLNGYGRGRSAAHFFWEDVATGVGYPMFLTSLTALLERKTVVKGVVTGTFWFEKRGQNYGLTLHESDPDFRQGD